jgi:hypothetical protein
MPLAERVCDQMGHLAPLRPAGHPGEVDEEMGIYRDEVTQIFEALFDIRAGVFKILGYIEGDDDEEEEEETLPDS